MRVYPPYVNKRIYTSADKQRIFDILDLEDELMEHIDRLEARGAKNIEEDLIVKCIRARIFTLKSQVPC